VGPSKKTLRPPSVLSWLWAWIRVLAKTQERIFRSRPVACRGGRTGRQPRASKTRGSSKEWNYRSSNAV